jgi:hypothetical protein
MKDSCRFNAGTRLLDLLQKFSEISMATVPHACNVAGCGGMTKPFVQPPLLHATITLYDEDEKWGTFESLKQTIKHTKHIHVYVVF